MKKLYIDFDGVIMNTNNAITNLLDEHQVDRTNYDETVNFLKKINWDKLLKECDEISNAFSHLKTLNDSNDFNVAILTHVCSEEEANEKKKLLTNKVGNLNVIPVPRNIDKCHYVDPKDSILIDDYSKNLELWQQNGGISIKFTNKEYDKFKSIYNLGDIINLL